MQGYSTNDVLTFIDYAANKGLMKKTTASSRKVSCGKIFAILSQDEAKDVRDIDLDDLMTKFGNLEGSKYSPDSLSVYKSRVSKSIDEFLKYKENPASYKPSGAFKVKPKPTKSGDGSGEKQTEAGENRPQTTATYAVATIDVPIAIRSDCIIQINGLPINLKHDEAKKIANVVLAMATIEE